MQTTNSVFKHPDPEILGILRPIIIDRAETKGFVRPSDQIYGFIDDSCLNRYLNKFDYLDIMEIGMDFEEKYIEKTKKSFRISEQGFNVLAQKKGFLLKERHGLKEFCYILHRCIEGEPVIYEPTNTEKIKEKFIQMNTKTKNFFAQKFTNIRAK